MRHLCALLGALALGLGAADASAGPPRPRVSATDASAGPAHGVGRPRPRASAADASTESAADGVAATRGLLQRLVGADHAAQFTLSLLSPAGCTGETGLCFGYAAGAAAGTVALSGTTGVELAMAANHYLKYVANVSVSWEQTGGSQTFLAPGALPSPAEKVHVERSTTYHYYANVCTFSYSFVWYDLADWVREIDWMALNGVNLPVRAHSQSPPQLYFQVCF